MVEALERYFMYLGDSFQVECPTGSGEMANMREVAEELRRRLISIFLPGADGRRPVFGDTEKFQTDPRWNFAPYFYEYFPRRQRRGAGRKSPDGMDRAGRGPDHRAAGARSPGWPQDVPSDYRRKSVLGQSGADVFGIRRVVSQRAEPARAGTPPRAEARRLTRLPHCIQRKSSGENSTSGWSNFHRKAVRAHCVQAAEAEYQLAKTAPAHSPEIRSAIKTARSARPDRVEIPFERLNQAKAPTSDGRTLAGGRR